MTENPSEDKDRDAYPTRRPLLVVLDTNVFVSNNLLKAAAGSTLVDLIVRGGGRILLPEVIELELKNVLRERLAENAKKAAGLLRGLEAIVSRDLLFKAPDAGELGTAIDKRLSELDAIVLRAPFTIEIARAALMRVIAGRPPSGNNNEQFRDCCIWEHCLHLCERYDVHLVTDDGDFYQNKKEGDSLADELRSELTSAKGNVFAYRTLPKLIEHIGALVPADEALKGRIAEGARETLRSLAGGVGFVLGDLTQRRVSVTTTTGSQNLLATFDLTYSMINKREQDAEARLNPELTASGSCGLSGPERAIRDLRLDKVSICWRDISGQLVVQPMALLFARGFAAGTASFGLGESLGSAS
jgi:hypothetical protein